MKKYLVALSGGADSVCLLLKTLDEGHAVEAAHCNFHLRGAESDRDESFVVSLCRRLGVPLHLAHFDTREYAALHKVSIELAARELRYRWFEQLRLDLGADAILVAHHRDDNVETVLMNMVRGTGIRGVSGIRPVNGHILRPLLDMSRSDIESFLARRGETYVTDSTNLEDDATRNLFRHHVVPLLQSINPRASENIHATSRHVAECEKIVAWALSEAMQRVVTRQGDAVLVDTAALLSFVSPSCLLHEIVHDDGFTSSQECDMLRALAQGRVGTTFRSATRMSVVDRRHLVVMSAAFRPVHYVIPETGTYTFPGLTLRITTLSVDKDFQVSRSPSTITIDLDKVRFPLTLRTVCEGDRFIPFGMKGSKLVSDYLTDIKATVLDRRHQLVLLDATSTILWLVGRRASHLCRITPQTRTALVLRTMSSGN